MAFGPNPETIAQGYELFERHLEQSQTLNDLLRQLASQEGPGLQTLAIAENEVPAGIEVDFPVPGGRRWIIPRLAVGGTFAVPKTIVSVMKANNRRLGGTIVNSGQTDCNLILASPESAGSQGGLAEIFLSANGGSWDYRLGSLLWCGSVCAKAIPLTIEKELIENTSLTVVEI